MNYRTILLFFACFVLCGCGPKQYGNFLTEPIETGYILTNAVGQMKEHYPPAKTRLYLTTPPVSDKFGTELIKEMRVAGYELFENQPQESKPENTIDFRYIIDKPVKSQFVRLTLFIGSETMSCGYDYENLQQISVWSKGTI